MSPVPRMAAIASHFRVGEEAVRSSGCIARILPHADDQKYLAARLVDLAGHAAPSRKPGFVLSDTVREPRRHEDVAPIHLRGAQRALQFLQVTLAQLEHGEPDPLETALVGVDPERQV